MKCTNPWCSYKFKNIDSIIAHICENEFQYFLKKPNVVAIGLGYKTQGGFNTLKKCIKVFVYKKISSNRLRTCEMIPKTYKAIDTDVVESGMFKSYRLNKRVRPVLGGYSVGPSSKKDGGSMCCLVTDTQDNYILSCNHVLAKGNELPLGTPILQPEVFYGGKYPQDTVGSLSEYVPIDFDHPTNYVDCAMAKVLNKPNVSSYIAFVGKPKGVVDAKLNEYAQKIGSTTERTQGKIYAISVTGQMEINGRDVTLKDQIMATTPADEGDSGGMLLNKEKFAMGLLVGGALGFTLYNKISRVLQELKVLLVRD